MILEFIMLILGLATHELKQVIEYRNTDVSISLWSLWKTRPYKLALMIVGGIAGFIFLIELDQLTMVNAFTIGFMANSMSDIVGGRSSIK